MSQCIICGSGKNLETVEYENTGEYKMCSRCIELGHGPDTDDDEWPDHDYKDNAEYFLNEVL